MVLEWGQPLGGSHLHADAVLHFREARALTVQQELGWDRGHPASGVSLGEELSPTHTLPCLATHPLLLSLWRGKG